MQMTAGEILLTGILYL